jgi:long-chain acyl-CoA synthetase
MKKLEKDLGKFERIKHFIVKRKPFSIETGELTPKQSVKRKVVEQKYAKEIDDMYALTVI